MSPPTLIFGCASIGDSFATHDSVLALTHTLKECSISRLDTAARYPPLSPGLSEKLLGDVGIGEAGFVVDTKIDIDGDGAGSLAEAAIEKSLKQSLESLHVVKVNVLYCHSPDPVTPLEQSAAAFDKHYKEGKFDHLGVSNFTVAMIAQWLAISTEKGYVKPSVYQGQYSLFCRGAEEKLLPFLREHGMRYVAFSPLAGGFLTGKLTSATPTSLADTRFRVPTGEAPNPIGAFFRTLYDKPTMHDAMEKMTNLCKENGLSEQEAALRWIIWHSKLAEWEGNGVILGASKGRQVVGNAEEIGKGKLSESVVKELEALWEGIKAEAVAIT